MLYVVATPIGNLDDITLRALEVLKSVDVIAAEDTRHSGNLLRHFEIRKPLISYHEHNEAMRAEQLAERLAAGENVALITDAGMPGLSDPGARLIRKCIERDLPYTIVPGVSAILTALVGSGISMERFCFRGFLPVKSGQRERELRAAAEREETSVFFESPYRIMKTLAACAEIMPDRQLCVARELTKKFEEFRRGTAAELLAHYEAHPAKGEITLVIRGAAVHAERTSHNDAATAERNSPDCFPLVKAAHPCDFARLFLQKIPWLTQLSKQAADNIASPRVTSSMSICSRVKPAKKTVFGDVLFHGDGDNLTHGNPLIEGATVTGEVVEQRKDKKVIAFKYRRRKGYHRTVGHRRKLTRIKITGISLSGKTSKTKKPKAEEAE